MEKELETTINVKFSILDDETIVEKVKDLALAVKEEPQLNVTRINVDIDFERRCFARP